MEEGMPVPPLCWCWLFPIKKGGTEVEQLLPFVSEVGFPVVVTLYLLHRIEAKLTLLNDSIQGLPAELRELIYPVKRTV
jgi:hypothetical protein